jgi:VCBS repeat-containing protein
VAENQPAGTVVGAFDTTDPDASDTFSYALVRGAGDADNASFSIDAGGNLRTAVPFDFEAKSSYTVRVRSTDAGGLFTEKVLTVGVTNLNDPPVLSVPGAQAAYEDVDKPISGLAVGDQDGDTLNVRLSVSHGTLSLGTTTGLTSTGNGTGIVSLSGSVADLNAALATLVYRGALNYSGSDSLSISAFDGRMGTGRSVSIVVTSAAQQASALQGQVAALQAAGVLKKGEANMLEQDLTLKGTRGDIGKVQQFLADVASLRRAGILTQAQADALSGPGNLLLLSVTQR